MAILPTWCGDLDDAQALRYHGEERRTPGGREGVNRAGAAVLVGESMAGTGSEG